jgi:hypothetical protein
MNSIYQKDFLKITMPKRILVVYYTQTGQLRDIIDSFARPFSGNADIEIVYEALQPHLPFPFPWTSDTFFQAMPESVSGIPCELKPLSLSGDENFDLVVIAWQPWYLSPSIPVHAFFQHPLSKGILKGKPVVTLIGSRNMWVMAQEDVKKYIRDAGGQLVGNIVLYDKAPNLLSVVTIIRWMFSGKKERFLVFPPAGVSQEDIEKAADYGKLVSDAILSGNTGSLNARLVEAGAVDVLPGLVMIEKRGKMFFRIWARFILCKGPYGEPARLVRVRLFKYYLLAVLYLVSPFASLLFFITKPFRKQALKKQISLYQSN